MKRLLVLIGLFLVISTPLMAQQNLEVTKVTTTPDTIYVDTPTTVVGLHITSDNATQSGTVAIYNKDASGTQYIELSTDDDTSTQTVNFTPYGVHYPNGLWIDYSEVHSITVFTKDRNGAQKLTR